MFNDQTLIDYHITIAPKLKFGEDNVLTSTIKGTLQLGNMTLHNVLYPVSATAESTRKSTNGPPPCLTMLVSKVSLLNRRIAYTRCHVLLGHPAISDTFRIAGFYQSNMSSGSCDDSEVLLLGRGLVGRLSCILREAGCFPFWFERASAIRFSLACRSACFLIASSSALSS